MKYKVVIRPEAEDDLKQAYSWYEDKRTGLGHDFLLQVDAGLNFVVRNPSIHSIEYKGTRKHLLKRFPYKIIYLIENERIEKASTLAPILLWREISVTFDHYLSTFYLNNRSFALGQSSADGSNTDPSPSSS